MSIETDISAILHQEDTLQFRGFTESDAWALGCQMREAALSRKLPLVMEIRLGTKPLFYFASPGTTPENPDWVRRKVNTVYRFECSSYRIAREYALRGAVFGPERGIDLKDYAAAGGGFPIRVKGVAGVIGAVTVSGVPQRDDHEFVVQALCQHLSKNYADLALPVESA